MDRKLIIFRSFRISILLKINDFPFTNFWLLKTLLQQKSIRVNSASIIMIHRGLYQPSLPHISVNIFVRFAPVLLIIFLREFTSPTFSFVLSKISINLCRSYPILFKVITGVRLQSFLKKSYYNCIDNQRFEVLSERLSECFDDNPLIESLS